MAGEQLVVPAPVGSTVPASGNEPVVLSRRFQARRQSEAFSLTMIRNGRELIKES
jgi:hypothetical protein